MKKLSIYLLLLIAGWSLTACTESHDDYPQPEVYAQGPLYNVTGFSATPTAAAGNPIDLATMPEATTTIKLFTMTRGTLPEGVVLKDVRLEAWPADKGENVSTKVVATEEGMVTRKGLEDMIYAHYGKKRTERTFKAKLLADAVSGTEAQLITMCSFTLRVTPIEMENSYYYVFGKVNSADAKAANKAIMTPDPENDQKFYFTSMFASSSDILVWNEMYWKVATNNGTKNAVAADYDKVYGMPSQEEANQKPMSGTSFQGLPAGTSIPVYFLAPTKAFYTFTIDLEAKTFKWELLANQNPTKYSTMTLKGLAADVAMTSVGVAGKTGIGTDKHNWCALNVNVAAESLVTVASGTTTWGFGDADGAWTVDYDQDNMWAKYCTTTGKAIKVPAGKYNIYFCDITGALHFVPVE